MQRHIVELQEKDHASTQVFQALASSSQTFTIIKNLQAGKDVAAIARTTKTSTVSPASVLQSPTCDACKFRRQHCDGSKPACRACQGRLFHCIYTNAAAPQVDRPELFHESMGIHEGENGGKRAKRLKSAKGLALNTDNNHPPPSPSAASLSNTTEEPSLLPVSRPRKAILCIFTIFPEAEGGLIIKLSLQIEKLPLRSEKTKRLHRVFLDDRAFAQSNQ